MYTETGWTPIELFNIAIVFITLIGVLLFSTWRMITGKQWYWRISAPLMWAGILSLLRYMGATTSMDETDIVLEGLEWLLLGAFLFSLGFIGALLRGVIVLCQHVCKRV